MTEARDVQRISHVQTQGRKNSVCDIESICSKQNQVACFYVHSFLDLGMNFVAQEFDDGALFLAVSGVSNPSHAFSTVFGSDVAQLLNLATAPVASALAVDGLNDVASFYRLGEYAKAATTNDFGKLNELHAKADIRTVATKTIHCLFPGHALQRELMLYAGRFQNFLENAFHHVDYIVFLNERHLDVNLSKLGLTICAKVFIAEATCNLVIALNAANHQHLLELLRALRQCIELAGVRTGRNNIVTCAFRSGVCQDRRFNLKEAALVKSRAHCLGNNMAKLQVCIHLGTTKVEITPLHASGFIGFDTVFDGERRSNRGVQHLNGACQNLDFTCCHIRVNGFVQARANLAGNLQGVFAAQMLSYMEVLFAYAIGVNNNLGVTLTITQVYEDKTAMVAVVPYPTGQGNLCVNVAAAQLPTRVGVHAVFVQIIGHGSAYSSFLSLPAAM